MSYNLHDKSPQDENENPFAFQVINLIMECQDMDGYGEWLDEKMGDSIDVESYFAVFTDLVDRCNEFDTPVIDAPRVEVWHEFIRCEIEEKGNQESNKYRVGAIITDSMGRVWREVSDE